MYYEINVSLGGSHLFATHKRSIQTSAQLQKVASIFVNKFPASEGFNISITYWAEEGRQVTVDSILKSKTDR